MQFSLIMLSLLSMYKVTWFNTNIDIPLYDDTFLYYDLPEPVLMLNDEIVNNESFYIEQGVNRTSLRVVNSNHVKTFKIDYRVTYDNLGISFDCTISFNITDNIAPTILKVPDIKMPVKSKLLSEKTILEEVFYEDNYYSNELLIVKIKNLSLVNPNIPNKYEIIYEVTDPSFNTGILIGYYEVINDTYPRITYDLPLKLEYGVKFDHYKYFKYYDEFDNNLTINVDTSNIDFTRVGNYSIYVSATNNNGLTTKVVTSLEIVDTIKPVINIKNKFTLEVNIHDENILKSLITNFYDNYDDLTLDDILINTNINFNQIGSYDVYYHLKDSNDNETIKSIIIDIKDQTKPEIILLQEEIIINVGSSNINWFNYLDYHDNYNSKNDLIIKFNEKNINFKVIDYYYLEVEVVDASNNKRIQLFQIKITDLISPEVTQMQEIILRDYTKKDNNYFKSFFAISDNYDDYNKINIIDLTNVEYNKTGFYNLELKFSDQSNNITIFNTEIYIIDDVAPIIELNTDELTIFKNNKQLNYHDYLITYSDNYSSQELLNLEITNNINYHEIGQYYIWYTITDTSNNKTIETLIVNIDLQYNELITGENLVIMQNSPYVLGTNVIFSEDTITYEAYPRNIDTSKIGKNEILYIAYDSRGNYQQYIQQVEIISVNEKIKVSDYYFLIIINLISISSLITITYLKFRKHDNL